MNETTNLVSKITGDHRKFQGMTYRAFAEALTEHLVNTSVTHATAMNWEKGKTDPNTDFLLTCLIVHNDWRADWAIECLCAKLPAVFDQSIDGRLVFLTSRVVAADFASVSA
jgi:transcriptional regulator with XRE-family HTH domain